MYGFGRVYTNAEMEKNVPECVNVRYDSEKYRFVLKKAMKKEQVRRMMCEPVHKARYINEADCHRPIRCSHSCSGDTGSGDHGEGGPGHM